MSKKLLLFMMLCLLCFPVSVQAAKPAPNAVSMAKKAAGGKWVSTRAGKKYRMANKKYAKSRWLKVGSSIYRFSAKGIRRTGWITWKKERYYASQNGKIYVKKWLTEADGKYYFLSTGVCARNRWITWKNNRYYFLSDGRLATNQMVTVKGKTYYVNPAGVQMKSTWISKDGSVYYFDKNGVRLQKKWLHSGEKYYYFHSKTGAMLKSRWIGDYYVGEDGARMTDCIVDGYYLDSTGKKTVQMFDGRYIFVGDSRMVGMEMSVPSQDTAYIAKVGEGCDWLETTGGKMLQAYLKTNPNVKVVLALGVNDLGNIRRYVTYYKKLINAYPQTTFFVLSVNPVDEKKEAEHGYKIKNSDIAAFNEVLKAEFGEPVYLDSYTQMKNQGFETRDGVHYLPEVYLSLYYFITGRIG